MNSSQFLKKAAVYVWREFIRPAILIGAIVFPLKSVVADWNWVPTGSMKPTLLEGDLVFVNKLAYDLKIPPPTKNLWVTLIPSPQGNAPKQGIFSLKAS